MSWELTRRRWIRTVNSKYILGYLPVVHTVIFLLEMAFIGRIVSRFNSFYYERPLLTMMVTNAILGGMADTVAQSITAIRDRVPRKPGVMNGGDTIALEIHELDRKKPLYDRDLLQESSLGPPPFDFERLTRFMAYGFFMAPLQFRWFKQLETWFPITQGSALGPAMKRVAADQIIFSPLGILCFFTTMTIAEGGGKRAVQQKLKDMYLPTLKANYYVWPAVQIVNFRLMPVQFQLPFVSTIGIAWTAYLSLTNAAEEPEIMTDPARLA